MARHEANLLPISERPLPEGPMWIDEEAFPVSYTHLDVYKRQLHSRH